MTDSSAPPLDSERAVGYSEVNRRAGGLPDYILSSSRRATLRMYMRGEGLLHARRRRAIGPFVHAYQEYGYGRKALELGIRQLGHIPEIHRHDRGIGEIRTQAAMFLVGA